MFVTQDFKRKTIFNQRRSAAWGPEGFLRQVSWKMLINLNWTDCWSNWPFASKSEEQTEKTERRLRRATMVAHFVSPLVATTFAVVYWVIGMYNVMHPGATTQWMEIEYVQRWSLLPIFIGPRSDHSLPMSVTHSLTNWLTDDLVENLMI